MEPAIPLSGLADALGLGHPGARHHVAVVGGGGKTTVVHALGAQLSGRRVLTCTTKMGHDQHLGLPLLIDPSDEAVLAAVTSSPAVVWSGVEGHQAIGVEPGRCDGWFEMVDHVLVEADGSRRRPFKAPAHYEPVVPDSATCLLSVIGADALGAAISESCHRADLVASLADLDVDDVLTPEAAAAVLVHDRGMRRALPPGARMVVVVNKVDGSNRSLVAATRARLAELDPSLPVVAVERFGSSGS